VLGDWRFETRKGVHRILIKIKKISSSAKLFGFLIRGLNSCNAFEQIERLEELGQLIATQGLNDFEPENNLKTLPSKSGIKIMEYKKRG
jgi:hypothetical protein